MDKRLFIVSNRLPLMISEEKKLLPASGGLVTAINSYLCCSSDQDFTHVYWAGVPGCKATDWEEATKNVQDTPFT
ncbi:MAG: hypothetical protein ICV66_13395, partial [Chitinophagaceae bacterium]|nr:hypothetical protein [Chitinophagaceae bacterium]